MDTGTADSKAKELLNEAGFNEKIRLIDCFTTQGNHIKNWPLPSLQCGNRTSVFRPAYKPEWKVMLDNMHQNKFDVVRYAWTADYNSPMSFLDTFLTGSSHNIPQYSNSDFDQMVIKAGETNDTAYYQKAMDILNHEMPIIPVYYYVINHMIKPYVGGVYVSPMDYISTKDLYIIKH